MLKLVFIFVRGRGGSVQLHLYKYMRTSICVYQLIVVPECAAGAPADPVPGTSTEHSMGSARPGRGDAASHRADTDTDTDSDTGSENDLRDADSPPGAPPDTRPKTVWVTATKRAGRYYNEQNEQIHPKRVRFVSTDIARMPAGGHAVRDTHSRASIVWMEYIMKTEGIHIRHARNGREEKIPNEDNSAQYRFDGFDERTRTVYEFNGCLWHGCPECYFTNNDQHIYHPHSRQTLRELHALTMKKEAFLKSCGYNVVTIWEHEYRHKLATDNDFAEFEKKFDMPERLSPRDAFYGGRTEIFRTNASVTGTTKKISYNDFTSLYPDVNKNSLYPKGHPIIDVGPNFLPLVLYFGIAKVKVLPPKQLYIPVLPVKMHGKLIFPLCNRCATLQRQSACECTDDQRMIIGTWTTMELLKAEEKGYKIEKFYEVYEWPKTFKKQTDTLFADYVNTFLKFKQEASGWPAGVVTDEQKADYVKRYHEHENIMLDPDNIAKNPALRYVSKLALNSLWGKFAQRDNKDKCTFVNDPNVLLELLCDPKVVLKDFHILDENTMQVIHCRDDQLVAENENTNIFIGIFTTAYARLKLYDILDQLGERLLYCDTDSVIYESDIGEPTLPLGDFLGDLTNELDDDDWIVEFTAAAPKCYTFRTYKGHVVTKVRGFTLNYQASQQLNFDSVQSMVTDGISVTTNSNMITRDKHSGRVSNKRCAKTCKMVNNKRRKIGFDTAPYGYNFSTNISTGQSVDSG